VPILATIFILFGLGYTIDYNSLSSILAAIGFADALCSAPETSQEWAPLDVQPFWFPARYLR